MRFINKSKFTIASIIAILLSSISAFAQTTNEPVAMADKFRADGKIYIVVLVLVTIFIGIIVYLFSLERKIKRLEKGDN